ARHRPHSPPLLPYTTLFRSLFVAEVVLHDRVAGRQGSATVAEQDLGAEVRLEVGDAAVGVPVVLVPEGAGAANVAVPLLDVAQRSEEHTSELQSRFDSVCRL